jgi:predicted RNA methylase
MLRFSKNILDQECDTDYSKFLVVEDSAHVSLMPYASKIVGELIVDALGFSPQSILDANAHIGCDTVNFCRQFGANCISIEIDKKIFKCLKKNLDAFDETKKSIAVHGNCLDFIKGFKHNMDLVYFDPPWGGPKYWRKKKIMLNLKTANGKLMPIYDVVKFTQDQKFANRIVIKVPSNFDFVTFKLHISLYDVRIVHKQPRKGRRNIAYYLVII